MTSYTSALPTEPSATRLGLKVGYAAGNMGKAVVWSSFESFLLYYLVTVAGVPPLLAGGVLATMMLWDGTADMAVSWWADRYGRADALARLISWGAPLCGISFFLIFNLPQAAGRWPLVAAIILCRIGYTLCDVGHNTLLVRVAATPHDASSVSGLRLIFSAAGGGLVGLAAAHVLRISDPEAQQSAFALFAAGGGALYVLVLTIARLATRDLPSMRAKAKVGEPGQVWRALWRNHAFRRVLLVMAVQSCLVPLFGRALPFFGAAHFDDPAWGGRALSVITLMQALALPGWMGLARRWSQARILILAHLMMMVALFGIMTMPAASMALAIVALIGVAQGGMSIAIWALLAGSVRSDSAASSEALPIGIFLAVLKYASGLGSALFATVIATQEMECTICDHLPLRLFDIATLCLPLAGSAIVALIIWCTPDQRSSKFK